MNFDKQLAGRWFRHRTAENILGRLHFTQRGSPVLAWPDLPPHATQLRPVDRGEIVEVRPDEVQRQIALQLGVDLYACGGDWFDDAARRAETLAGMVIGRLMALSNAGLDSAGIVPHLRTAEVVAATLTTPVGDPRGGRPLYCPACGLLGFADRRAGSTFACSRCQAVISLHGRQLTAEMPGQEGGDG